MERHAARTIPMIPQEEEEEADIVGGTQRKGDRDEGEGKTSWMDGEGGSFFFVGNQTSILKIIYL